MSTKKINLSALKTEIKTPYPVEENTQKEENIASKTTLSSKPKIRISLKNLGINQEKENQIPSFSQEKQKSKETKTTSPEIKSPLDKVNKVQSKISLKVSQIQENKDSLVETKNQITKSEPIENNTDKKSTKDTPKTHISGEEKSQKEESQTKISSFQITDGDTNLTLVQEKKSEIFGRYAGSYTAAKEIKAEKLQEVLEEKEVIKKKKEKNIVKTEKTTKKDKKISKKFLLTGGTGVIAIVSIGFFWILGGGNIYSNILQSSHTADENISLVEDTQILEETSGDLDEINDNDNSDVVNINQEQDIDLDAKKIILEKKIYDHFINKSK